MAGAVGASLLVAGCYDDDLRAEGIIDILYAVGDVIIAIIRSISLAF